MDSLLIILAMIVVEMIVEAMILGTVIEEDKLGKEIEGKVHEMGDFSLIMVALFVLYFYNTYLIIHPFTQ